MTYISNNTVVWDLLNKKWICAECNGEQLYVDNPNPGEFIRKHADCKRDAEAVLTNLAKVKETLLATEKYFMQLYVDAKNGESGAYRTAALKFKELASRIAIPTNNKAKSALEDAIREVENQLYRLPIDGAGVSERKDILSAKIGRYRTALESLS